MEKLPISVLALLARQWPEAQGYSAFDSIFRGERRAFRRSDPSYYHIREHADISIVPITFEEAIALVREGVLRGLAAEQADGVLINEHAQHALNDFCSQVYDAWRQFQTRLDEVRSAVAD